MVAVSFHSLGAEKYAVMIRKVSLFHSSSGHVMLRESEGEERNLNVGVEGRMGGGGQPKWVKGQASDLLKHC